MLHTLKKATYIGEHDPANASFVDYKNRIASIEKMIKAISNASKAVELNWKTIARSQEDNANAFLTRFPDDNEIRSIAKTSESSAENISRTIIETMNNPAAEYKKINEMVALYKAEIDEVKKKYPKVDDAKLEYEMYKSKITSLEDAKKKDEERVNRNREKVDHAKIEYDNVINTVLDEMKTIYAKRTAVFKAAFTAYWTAHQTYLDLFDQHLKPVDDYVAQHEAKLLALDVSAFASAQETENTSGLMSSFIGGK